MSDNASESAESCRPEIRRPPEYAAIVVETRQITPCIRRIVFAAEGLAAAFSTPSGAHAPYLKLILGEPEARIVRTYSVRHLDAARDELHVDFVVHGHDGPGSAFGRDAKPGAEVGLRGPGHLAVATCRHHCLAADHCGLPALAHLLEHLPADAEGYAVVEVPDRSEIHALAAPPGIALDWLVRTDGSPSRIGAALAARAADRCDGMLLWCGAEAQIAREVRQLGRNRWGLTPQLCQVLNYWRRGRPEGTFSFMT